MSGKMNFSRRREQRENRFERRTFGDRGELGISELRIVGSILNRSYAG